MKNKQLSTQFITTHEYIMVDKIVSEIMRKVKINVDIVKSLCL